MSGSESIIIENKENRDFNISLTAFYYINPGSIKYAYRIKGLNDQWVETGFNRAVNLMNMHAGNYNFEVRSTNSDGVWMDNIAVMPICIKPVFTETVWALILYILLFILFITLVVLTILRVTNLKS